MAGKKQRRLPTSRDLSREPPKYLLYIPQGKNAGLVFYPSEKDFADEAAIACGGKVVVYLRSP